MQKLVVMSFLLLMYSSSMERVSLWRSSCWSSKKSQKISDLPCHLGLWQNWGVRVTSILRMVWAMGFTEYSTARNGRYSQNLFNSATLGWCFFSPSSACRPKSSCSSRQRPTVSLLLAKSSQQCWLRKPSCCFLVLMALQPEQLNLVNCLRGESSLQTLFSMYLHHSRMTLTFSAWFFLLHRSSMQRSIRMEFCTTYCVSFMSEKFSQVTSLRQPWRSRMTFWGVSMWAPSWMLTVVPSRFMMKSGSSSRIQYFMSSLSSSISSGLGLMLSNSLHSERMLRICRSVLYSNRFFMEGSSAEQMWRAWQKWAIVSHLMQQWEVILPSSVEVTDMLVWSSRISLIWSSSRSTSFTRSRMKMSQLYSFCAQFAPRWHPYISGHLFSRTARNVYLSQSNASSSLVTVPEVISALRDSLRRFKKRDSMGELLVRAPMQWLTLEWSDMRVASPVVSYWGRPALPNICCTSRMLRFLLSIWVGSQMSVPLMITAYAGKFTPQARVAVASKIFTSPFWNIFSTMFLSALTMPAWWKPTLPWDSFRRFLSLMAGYFLFMSAAGFRMCSSLSCLALSTMNSQYLTVSLRECTKIRTCLSFLRWPRAMSQAFSLQISSCLLFLLMLLLESLGFLTPMKLITRGTGRQLLSKKNSPFSGFTCRNAAQSRQLGRVALRATTRMCLWVRSTVLNILATMLSMTQPLSSLSRCTSSRITKCTVSRMLVLLRVVTSHFSGVVTKMLVVSSSLWESWMSPVDSLVFRWGSLVENLSTNSLANAFIGEIYTILTSVSDPACLIACSTLRVAMLVLPDPVGAQISMLSLQLKAWSNTTLWMVFRNSDSKHFEYLGPMKSSTRMRSTSSWLSLGRGSMRNWMYSVLSNLFRVGTFRISSLSRILRKSRAQVASSTLIHWFSFSFSGFFFFWLPSSNLTFTSPSRNLLCSRNSHSQFLKVTRYLIGWSSLGMRVLSSWERSSLDCNLQSRILRNKSKRRSFQYSGEFLMRMSLNLSQKVLTQSRCFLACFCLSFFSVLYIWKSTQLGSRLKRAASLQVDLSRGTDFSYDSFTISYSGFFGFMQISSGCSKSWSSSSLVLSRRSFWLGRANLLLSIHSCRMRAALRTLKGLLLSQPGIFSLSSSVSLHSVFWQRQSWHSYSKFRFIPMLKLNKRLNTNSLTFQLSPLLSNHPIIRSPLSLLSDHPLFHTYYIYQCKQIKPNSCPSDSGTPSSPPPTSSPTSSKTWSQTKKLECLPPPGPKRSPCTLLTNSKANSKELSIPTQTGAISQCRVITVFTRTPLAPWVS